MPNIGALIIRMGFLLRGLYKAYYKGSILGYLESSAQAQNPRPIAIEVADSSADWQWALPGP